MTPRERAPEEAAHTRSKRRYALTHAREARALRTPALARNVRWTPIALTNATVILEVITENAIHALVPIRRRIALHGFPASRAGTAAGIRQAAAPTRDFADMFTRATHQRLLARAPSHGEVLEHIHGPAMVLTFARATYATETRSWARLMNITQ
jgi:hypothetical protein